MNQSLNYGDPSSGFLTKNKRPTVRSCDDMQLPKIHKNQNARIRGEICVNNTYLNFIFQA